MAEETHFRVRYQCSPYHTDSALWPVIQQLNHAAGLAADDPLEARLDKLEALNYVYMDYNAEVSKIAFLADNQNMVQINVYGTKVPASQANKCIDHSIIVNYDPT